MLYLTQSAFNFNFIFESFLHHVLFAAVFGGENHLSNSRITHERFT